jgi:hypothetical protein
MVKDADVRSFGAVKENPTRTELLAEMLVNLTNILRGPVLCESDM